MKNIGKRLLSLAIVLVMVLSMVPAAPHSHVHAASVEEGHVAAIGDTGYATIDEALAAAVDGDTVTLLQDVTMSASYAGVEGASITIDTDGHTLSTGTAGKFFINQSDCDITFIGGGTVDFTGATSTKQMNYLVKRSTLTFQGVTVKFVSNTSDGRVIFGAEAATSTVCFDNATVDFTCTTSASYGVFRTLTVEMKNGTTFDFHGSGSRARFLREGILVMDDSTLNIKYSSYTFYDTSVYVRNGSTITTANMGGNFTYNSNATVETYYVDGTSTVEASGCSFNHTVILGEGAVFNATATNPTATAVVEAFDEDGEFVAVYTDVPAAPTEGNTYVIVGGEHASVPEGFTVKGGTFTFDPSAYVADGYVAKDEDGDGVWTVEVAPAHTHSFTGTITKPATCVETGTMTYTCECGEGTYTEEIPATGVHTEDTREEDRVEATCGEAGSYNLVTFCSVCKEVLKTEPKTISATGNHAWGDWETIEGATCVEDGSKKRECANCDAEETDVIPATGIHTEDTREEDRVEATCGEAGSYNLVTFCSVCKEVLKTEPKIISATGNHAWGDWETIEGATCVEDGSKKRECANCDAEETDVIPATGIHTEDTREEDRVEATCGEAGSYNLVTFCSVCKEVLKTEPKIISATGNHAWGDWETIEGATCVEDGSKKRECANCDASETEVIKATGEHAMGGWVITVQPTCTDNGLERSECANCDYFDEKEITNLGHDYVGVETQAPTCTAVGKMTYTCKNDASHTYTEDIPVIAHSYVDVVTPPTCTDNGYTTYTCSACGHSYVANEVIASGHNYVGVVTPPALNEQGYTTYTCSVCGDTKVDDYTPALKGEASINDFGYATLEEAIAAAQAGETVILNTDATIENPVYITKDIVIDGNDKTLTYTGTNRAISVENTANGADLTINDLTVVAANAERGINYNTTGALVLNNVDVTAKLYAVNLPGSSIGANVTITDSELVGRNTLNVWGKDAVINVTDTVITSDDGNASEGYAAIILNDMAEGAVVNVTGGELNAADDSSTTVNGTVTGVINVSDSTVVNGKQIILVAYVGAAGFDDLQEAIDYAAEKGGTVKLIRDVTIEAVSDSTLGKVGIILDGVTLDGNGKVLTVTGAGGLSDASADRIGNAIFVPTSATIKNLKVVGGWRGIYISKNATSVTLDGVTVVDSARGLVFNSLDAAGTINPDATLVVKNSTLGGWCGIGRVASATFENTTIVKNGSTRGSGLDLRVNTTLTGCTFETGTELGAEDLPAGAVVTKDANTTVAAPEDYKWVNNVLTAKDYVAEVNGVKYESLEEAIAAANAGDIVYLTDDASGNGIVIDKNLTIDLGGNTYTIDGTLVGSTGTQTLAFQLKAGNDITITNGTITSTNAKMLIQNYANLTLDNVTLDGTASDVMQYVLSNNSGDVAINESTIKANDGVVAFDVCDFQSYAAPTVTVTDSTIVGEIEISTDSKDTTAGDTLSLNLVSGDFSAATLDVLEETAVVTKGADATVAAPEDYKWVGDVLVAKNYVAEVNGVKYESLEEAVAAANAGDIVYLTDNATGNGIVIDKDLTIDLGGNTYTIDGTLVGSTGTQTLAFQLKKDNDITITNGTITSTNAKMLIQNYANLTLDNVTLDGTNSDVMQYVLSNNSGDVAINESTIKANDGVVAFDVCDFQSYAAPTVTVTDSTIVGEIEISTDSRDTTAGDTLSLNLVSGDFSAATLDVLEETAVVTKGVDATVTAPEDYKWVDNVLVAKVYVAEIENVGKYETLADAIADAEAGDTIVLIADAETEPVLIPEGVVLDLNGNTVSGTVAGTISVNGGSIITVDDYAIAGGEGSAYLTENATFIIDVNNNITVAAGDVVLGQSMNTMPGQILTIAEGATFTIPAGKVLNVYSNLIVNGTVINNGTIAIFEGGYVTGDIAGTFKMAGGTFATSDYVMAGVAADAIYYTEDAVFTVAANYDTTIVSGAMKLNLAQWWTLPGQKLVVESGATFEVPAGTKLSVNGSNVVVNGTAIVDGTVELLSADATVAYADDSLLANFTTPAGDCVWYNEGKYIVHTHTVVEDAEVAPTCTETGLTAGSHCSVCDEVLVAQEEVAALGHDYVGVETKAPACGVEGELTYTCGNCGDTYTEAIAALTHVEGAEVEAERVAPTATEDGYIKWVVNCELCGAQMSERTEVLPATGVVVAVIGNSEYISVQAALDAATADQTVQLVAPAEESYIMVPAGVILDLGGQTLTVGSAASFGTIMGEGKLVVDEYGLAMTNNGNYLPVFEGDGYVFQNVELAISTKNSGWSEDTYNIAFYNNNAASDKYLANVMVNGNNKLDVIIRATWTTGTGDSAVQDFIFREGVEADYGTYVNNGKYPTFGFAITGAEALDGFAVTVVYRMNVGNYIVEVTNTSVSVSGNAGAKVESVENAENVATVNGVGYTSVSEALANAASGATVTVTAPSTEAAIMVPAGVILDLGGQTLTVGSAASFGTIMGEGKLIVDEYGLAMTNNGNYLPVFEGDGYVFQNVELAISTKNSGWSEDTYNIAFYNNNAASDKYLANVMVNGNNKLDVIIRATWTTGTGDSAVQDFIFREGVEADYGTYVNNGKYPTFGFAITGAEALDGFAVTVVYRMNVGNYIVEVAN